MARSNVVQLKKEPTIGELIDQLADCEARRTEHSNLGKKLDLEKTELTTKIFNAMDAQGTRVSESPKSHRRVSISESEEPKTLDWDAFMAWAVKTKNLHLVQRRIGAPAWREIKNLEACRKTLNKRTVEVDGKKVTIYEVPGIETFTKRNLSFTTAK